MKLTEKQKFIDARLWAAEEILKRNLLLFNDSTESYELDNQTYYFNTRLNRSKERQHDLVEECISVIKKERSPTGSKRAARLMLKVILGKGRVDNLIKAYAVVENRSDSLVSGWRKAVIQRDKQCVECGNVDDLHAHHISHWADDPINRINIDNGVTLCKGCHAKQHPEIASLILA